jgi:two-component system, OmpR family, alkaline phosphatase synthesis response regulator PhoP
MKLLLVVDDEYAIVATLAQLLADEGYEVLTAHDGRQALEVLQSARPVACLVDLMMPVMGGAELIEKMHADPELARIPVILMSAAARREHLELPGVVGVLRKPFGMRELLGALNGVVSS